MRAVRNHGEYRSIGLLEVAPGNGRRRHHFFHHHPANVVFRGGDVLDALGDGPAIGSGLEIPLRFRKTFRRLQDTFLRAFKIL